MDFPVAPPPLTSPAQAHTPSDPFWQSTPRSNVGNAGNAPLRPVIVYSQMAVPPRTASSVPNGPKSRYTAMLARRPQCTHVTTCRTHQGDLTCSMCGRVPNVGWVYACQQDERLPDSNQLPNLAALSAATANAENTFEINAQMAEYLGLKPDVVSGIRSQHYTMPQVDKLLAQKQQLIRVITQQEGQAAKLAMLEWEAALASESFQNAKTLNDYATKARPMAGMPPSPASHPSNGLSPKDILAIKRMSQRCNFRVCHTCRPYFRDRIYSSLESVFDGEVPDLTPADTMHLPVMDRDIALTIGMRKAPTPLPHSPESVHGQRFPFRDSEETEDDISVDWTPTTADATDAESDDDPHPCPGPGKCPAYSHQDGGCAYDNGFEDGNRAFHHSQGIPPDPVTPEHSRDHISRRSVSALDTPGGASSTASSVSLPTPATVPSFSALPRREESDTSMMRGFNLPAKASSFGGAFGQGDRNVGLGLHLNNKSSGSSLGNEVEVQGGVALTEEAVETGLPDIATN